MAVSKQGRYLALTILLTTPCGLTSQALATHSWNDVFAHGFQSLEELGDAERIGVDSPPSLLQPIYGLCDGNAPDSIFLIGRSEYTRGDQGWRPSFIAADLDKDRHGRFQRVSAPPQPDTLFVPVVRTICDTSGRPNSLIVEHGGRFVRMTIPSEPWLGMIWLEGRGHDGNPTALRWSSVVESFETIDDAEARWRGSSWRQRAIDSIRAGQIYVGMTPEMVRESWGNPEQVNRTTTASQVREQWVYGRRNYVYFENNRVTAIQN